MTLGRPNWGDKVKLNAEKQAGGGFHKSHGNSGPMVQAAPVGRPAATPEIPVAPVPAPQNPQTSPQVPPQQIALMQNYARARATDTNWAQLASAADAGPWVRYYAQVAHAQLMAAAQALKANTPDFLG